MSLLSYDQFKKFDSATALSIIDAASPKRPAADSEGESTPASRPLSAEELNALLTPFDMKRLQSYCENMIEHHVIIDLVPILSVLFFSRKLGSECTLSAAQQAILLALGLQRKPVEALEGELGLTPSQVLALFAKIVRRIVKTLQDIQREGVGRDLPAEQEGVQRLGLAAQQSFRPVEQSVEEELRAEKRQERDDADEEMTEDKAKQRELLDSVDLAQ
jgi:N-acetyltransferase 10